MKKPVRVISANVLERIAEPASRFYPNYLAYRNREITRAELVARLNSQISARQIRNRAGKLLEQRVEGGLLREDGTVLYPIRGKLPILLIDEGVLLALEPLKRRIKSACP